MTNSLSGRIRAGLGACLFALPLMASAQTHAYLEISSASVDFGRVWVGNEGHGYLQVRNACERGITIEGYVVPVTLTVTP